MAGQRKGKTAAAAAPLPRAVDRAAGRGAAAGLRRAARRGTADQTAAPADAESGDEGFSLSAFEADLNEKLAAIDGVGRVELMLSLDQSEEAVYAVNTRQTTSESSGESWRAT